MPLPELFGSSVGPSFGSLFSLCLFRFSFLWSAGSKLLFILLLSSVQSIVAIFEVQVCLCLLKNLYFNYFCAVSGEDRTKYVQPVTLIRSFLVFLIMVCLLRQVV